MNDLSTIAIEMKEKAEKIILDETGVSHYFIDSAQNGVSEVYTIKNVEGFAFEPTIRYIKRLKKFEFYNNIRYSDYSTETEPNNIFCNIGIDEITDQSFDTMYELFIFFKKILKKSELISNEAKEIFIF